MEGTIIGVFGSDPNLKSSFENSIAKKSEVEGITIYHKNEGSLRFSFLDDSSFPEKIQGYARIASLSDYAYYVLPSTPKLTPPDGELVVLVDSFGLNGSILAIDSSPRVDPNLAFKGLRLANFRLEERSSKSSIIDLSGIRAGDSKGHGALVYIDRAFNVKGVGLVVLGFVVSGKISIHDKLRLIPGAPGKTAEVKGIQINDEDHENAGSGIRVGLSLRNVELKDLEKTSWLDDGSFNVTNKIMFEFNQSRYYKQNVAGRDLHIQCPGELLVAKVSQGNTDRTLVANLPSDVPAWNGMKISLIDLNSKSLRVAGGGTVFL
ncbi:MAG TPA: EF-Tu/IF-2/RF-3 family GTPase [Nitrososphaerales archaeon]|nr:EF-Tu/IF-2/RF-3 family GTPase [Nitrososphaerales archaeon]